MGTIPHDEPYIAPSSLGVVIRKRGLFYRPGWAGYTASVNEAGVYDRAVAKRHAEKTEGVTVHEMTEFLMDDKELEKEARRIALEHDLDPDDARLGYPAWQIDWILEAARKRTRERT